MIKVRNCQTRFH